MVNGCRLMGDVVSDQVREGVRDREEVTAGGLASAVILLGTS